MSTVSLSEIKLELLRLLGDDQDLTAYEVSGQEYTHEHMLDGIRAGLDAICTRCWKRDSIAVLAGATELEIPDGVIGVEAVWDKTNVSMIPRVFLTHGNLASSINGWLPYPTGKATFISPIGENGAIAYVSKMWDYPTTDDELLEPPNIALTSVLFFAASYCLVRPSVGAAVIRQYNSRVDSGNPSDNPVMDMSTFMLKRYDIELQRIPMMEKA